MVVIVYDIPDDKRRTKLAHFLGGYGNRIQLSVFECFITIEEMRELYGLVQNKVKPEEDNVRFYWISSESASLALTIGSDKPSPPPSYYII